MVIGTAAGLHNGATVALSIALAFVFGYALTMRGGPEGGRAAAAGAEGGAGRRHPVHRRHGDHRQHRHGDDPPRRMDAGLADLLFWGALAGSLALAFVITTPVNRWMIGRGKGHAVVHAYH